jgi:homoserine kinase
MRRVIVSVPASTANLGAGFDCLALALNLRNTVTVVDWGEGHGLDLEIEGEGAGSLPRDDDNLLARALRRLFDEVGRRPEGRLSLHAHNRIPLGSGLGSSAATIVAGLAAANALVGEPLGHAALLRLATEMEGHPDNAAAALSGGLALVSATGDEVMARTLRTPPLRVVVALPALHLSTAEARAALPALLEPSGADPLPVVVAAVVESFRRRPGFLRAALRKSMGDAAVWEPMRAHGHFVADQFLARLARDAGERPAPDAELRIRFAFQIMNGTLINALINAPGPVQIDHPALMAQLVRAMRLVIASDDAPQAPIDVQPRKVASISRS